MTPELLAMNPGQTRLTIKMIVGDDLRDDLRDDHLNVLCRVTRVLRDAVCDGLLNGDLAILLW